MWRASADELVYRVPNLGTAETLRKILPRVFNALESESADIVILDDDTSGGAVSVIYDPETEVYEVRHAYHPKVDTPKFPIPPGWVQARNKAATNFMSQIVRNIRSFGRKAEIDPETPRDWF